MRQEVIGRGNRDVQDIILFLGEAYSLVRETVMCTLLDKREHISVRCVIEARGGPRGIHSCSERWETRKERE